MKHQKIYYKTNLKEFSTMAEQLKTRIMIKNARASYANIFQAKAINEGDDEKYSISLIIPKDDEKTIANINKAIENAKEVGKEKFGGKIPKNLKTPLRDGDDEREDDEAYQGCYFMNATTKRKPQVLDTVGQRTDDPDEVYSGCYIHITVNFYAFAVSGNKGIACGLGNIMKAKDGEPLSGGGAKAEDEFAEFINFDADLDDMFD